MENIVEGVEDEREKEGSPANPQRCEDRGGCDGVRNSVSVNHSDGLLGHYQGHHCHTENIFYVYLGRYSTVNTDLI